MNTSNPPWRATAAPPSYNNPYGQCSYAKIYSDNTFTYASAFSGGAFTSVSARRTLTQREPPPPAVPVKQHLSSPQPPVVPASAPKKPMTWSLKVRQYVQRSFDTDNMVDGVSQEDMQAKLKEIIGAATAAGTVDAIDWDLEPLPQVVIQQERARSFSNSANLPIPLAMPHSSPIASGSANNFQYVDESKKRKSSELSEQIHDSAPPWRANSRNVFEDRTIHPPAADKRQRINSPKKQSSKFQDASEKEKRKKRFELESNGYTSPKAAPYHNDDLSQNRESTGPIVGRSQELEKRYLRLTSAPNPDNVRPLPVLRKTLDLLKSKWRKEGNYAYICDQFKSLRQDLTVQHIKDEFTVTVYEIHARIALEKGDLGEYNQCQTQLRALYAQNLGGHPTEFKAYRILYFLHTCNRTDMNDVLADLTATDKLDPAVKQALELRSSLALGNFHKFFKLYQETPNMGAYLIDMFVERERLVALAHMSRV